MKSFVHPPRTTMTSKSQIATVLWTLHLHGPVEDISGLATKVLLDRVHELGHPAMSVNALNRVVNSFCATTRSGSEYAQYDYIEREIRGKRTYKIALTVDPHQVPFPPNPFKDRPRFKPSLPSAPALPVIATAAPDAPAESFARQAQFDGIVEPEPEPELEPEREPEPERGESAEPVMDTGTSTPPGEVAGEIGALEPYDVDVPVSANGHDNVDQDLYELPADLLAELDRRDNRSSTDLVAAAIGMLSEAQALIGSERLDLVTVGISEQIDRRFGEYRVLQDRVARGDERLRHVLRQYEKVVALARNLRRENAVLRQRLAAEKTSA